MPANAAATQLGIPLALRLTGDSAPVRLIISWHFFFTALRKQRLPSREDWLTHFAFDDPGVTLLPDALISLEEVLREALAPEPEREERELEILSELTERKRARLLNARSVFDGTIHERGEVDDQGA